MHNSNLFPSRYDALNSEMSSNAKKFANELAQLKLEVAVIYIILM
jgi:hypothetical protein